MYDEKPRLSTVDQDEATRCVAALGGSGARPEVVPLVEVRSGRTTWSVIANFGNRRSFVDLDAALSGEAVEVEPPPMRWLALYLSPEALRREWGASAPDLKRKGRPGRTER